MHGLKNQKPDAKGTRLQQPRAVLSWLRELRTGKKQSYGRPQQGGAVERHLLRIGSSAHLEKDKITGTAEKDTYGQQPPKERFSAVKAQHQQEQPHEPGKVVQALQHRLQIIKQKTAQRPSGADGRNAIGLRMEQDQRQSDPKQRQALAVDCHNHSSFY